MDLVPNSEQTALREMAVDLVASLVRERRLAEIVDSGGVKPSLWLRLATAGLIGLSLPEELGGGGVGLVDETILFEEVGAALLPAPLYSTVALCLPLLAATNPALGLVGPAVTGTRRYALAAAAPGAGAPLGANTLDAPGPLDVDGPAEAPVLTGTRSWVLEGAGADGYLVPVIAADGPVVYLVEAGPAVDVTPLSAVDTSRPAATLRLSGAPAQRLLDGAAAAGALADLRRRALLLACAEAVGISARMLSTTVEYAKTRTQFGRPIGAYQGVSHALAGTYVDVELGRSLVLLAALEPSESHLLAAAARILPVSVRACECAIQLHGGIGMTWDAVLHRYYKRALTVQASFPRPALLHESLARIQLDA